MTFFLAIAAGLLLAVVGGRIADRRPLFACWWYGSWAVACTVVAAVNAAEGSWGWAAWMGVCAVVNGVTWWGHWKRRRRKRAPRTYGYKARAAIAALVRKAREAAKPRPVLRPAPGGAR